MRYNVLCVVVVLCFVVATTRGATNIGNFITPCSIKDPELSSCVLTQTKALWPKIVSGVKDWKMLPLDPMRIQKLELADGGNSAVNLKLGGTNIAFTGYKDLEFESARADPKNLRFEFTISVPQFNGSGQYHMDGKLLVFPIRGEGDFNFKYDNLRFNISFHFKHVEQGGKKILKLEDVTHKIIKIEKIYHYYDNLFGNKELSDQMNKVLNDNAQAMVAELKGRFDDTLAGMAFSFMEPMFNHIPSADLIKDLD